MKQFSKVVLVILVAGGVVFSKALHEKTTPPSPLTDYQSYTAQRLRSHFPNVPLVTQNGRKVRFYDDLIRGKTVMIQFMFANCDRYCPIVTPNLVKVQKELRRRGAKDISMISITVDPAHDTPAVLKQYAEKFHAQPGWMFLTGRKEDIDLIRRQLGVYDPDDKKIEHTNVLTMGSEPSGRWVAIEALAKPYDIAETAFRLSSTANVSMQQRDRRRK